MGPRGLIRSALVSWTDRETPAIICPMGRERLSPVGGPEQETRAVQSLETGDLSEEEVRALRTLKEDALRYGVRLRFKDSDRTRRTLDVSDNLIRARYEMQLAISRVQARANWGAFPKLPKDEQDEYVRLINMTPEERAEIGEGWRRPMDMLHAPQVEDVPPEELEDYVLEYDALQAERVLDEGNYDPLTGESIRKIKADPDRSLEYLSDLTDRLTRERHTFQEAMALQMERPGVISYHHLSADDYLRDVKERLDVE